MGESNDEVNTTGKRSEQGNEKNWRGSNMEGVGNKYRRRWKRYKIMGRMFENAMRNYEVDYHLKYL